MTAVSSVDLTNVELEIKEAIGSQRFDLWFSGNTNLVIDRDALEIGVPNRFFREWLESHFQDEIREAARRVVGSPLPIRFRIDPTLFQRSRKEQPVAPKAKRPAKALPAKRPGRPSRYALSRFVVGTPNRVAHAASSALIENPRESYSPLLIHGGIGLGKTHLLRAVEEALRGQHANLKVLALSCEEFTNQFVEAMRSNKLAVFRRKVRQLDVLIVDDVQFLVGKRGIQEEFLHTLNSLEARGGKVVLGCDVHPRRLGKIAEELRSRFVAGMVARLDPPNQEMRRQILREKAAQRLMDLREDVIGFLAENIRSNVCELEGALNYLEHYCETMEASLDLETARGALVEILRHQVPVLRVGDIRGKACDMFSLNPKLISQRSRSRAVSHPRMLLLYLARKYTQATYSEIGKAIGGLNHSSVIAAERKVTKMIAQDEEIVLGERTWKVRDAIETFERELGRA
ncbi:Chromosomal replication initiator protein DnaA [Planctomycetes bacterium Pan216]|uniref:Chromosomal replication initiator protein DnaA n=1 Tax=Kolteria novifilia TaxID=2527975 RepID=A0A518B6J2_9BACT|nr:Chromosomal replication initiator protein DnaA [Planctomycetes bacterium Pan216]